MATSADGISSFWGCDQRHAKRRCATDESGVSSATETPFGGWEAPSEARHKGREPKLRKLRALVVLVALAGLLAQARSADAAPAISSDGLSPSITTNAHDRTITIYGSGFEPGAVVELVELFPGSENLAGQERAEEVLAARSNGTVSSGGSVISGAVLPTTGIAPSSPANTRPDVDVSWFVRVRNPDGKQAYSREFTVDDSGPLSLTTTRHEIVAGTSKEVVLRGANFARRAAFSASTPPPSSYQGANTISFSNPTYVDSTTYRVTIAVPSDFPNGYEATITMTNTDGQAQSCVCVVVNKIALPETPTVRKISPTGAANTGTANPTVYGTKYKANVTQAALVGYCHPDQPDCPLGGHRIEFSGETITDREDRLAGQDATDDLVTGAVDLTRQPPGRYDIVVTNTVGGQSASGRRERAFDVIADPPQLTKPSAPYAVGAGDGSAQTLTIGGSDFALLDLVEIVGVGSARVTDPSKVTASSLTVVLRPDVNARSGLHDLRVTHTDGAATTCVGCVKVSNTVPARDRFIRGAFVHFTGKAPTNTELSGWRTKLASGTPRLELTRTLSRSDAYAGAEIERLYQVVLGRTADSAGKETWMKEIRRGVRIDTIAAKFYGSAEYFARKGSTNGGYVEALYRDILGRASDPGGKANWVAQLDSKRMTRTQVAAAFYGSRESRTSRSSRLYTFVFGTTASSTQLAPWIDRIGQVGDLEVVARMAAEPAFYERMTGEKP